jgi:uncharacterized protein (TIGR03435 family)
MIMNCHLLLTVRILAIACLLMVGAPPRVRAQSPLAADSRVFDVASIKPNKSGGVLDAMVLQPGGRFTATNATLRELIRVAYGIQTSQIVGGPNWIGSERFDIVAKGEGDALPSLVMIQRLLAERFQLRAHTETRELSLYALVMARTDSRLGPQLRVSRVDCNAGFPPPGERQYCDAFVGSAPRFVAGGVSMAQLAISLSRQVRAIVVDRTGLRETFDFELQWTPDRLPPRAPDTPADQPLRLNGTVVDPNGPSIFTALQEQLGLKLDSQKGPVDVIVIDSVSPPTPD